MNQPNRARLVFAVYLLFAAASSDAAHQIVAPKTSGIQVILAVDSRGGPKGTAVNGAKMATLLHSIKELGIEVNVTEINPLRMSAGEIIAAIKRLDPVKTQAKTLFVYYAGHGGTDPRSTVLAEMKALNPPLAILLTDSCSTETFQEQYPMATAPFLDLKMVENLFLQHRGVVDVNSSSYSATEGIYQSAFYHPLKGGLFTNAFCDMFVKYSDDFPATITPFGEGQSDEVVPWQSQRFGNAPTWEYDRTKDGFLEWGEAIDHLKAVMIDRFTVYKKEVASGTSFRMTDPRDLKKLDEQVSQDPQIFGTLAQPSDRPAGVPINGKSPVGTAAKQRKMRLGAFLAEYSGRGRVVVSGITPKSPASRIVVWEGGKPTTTSMMVGDTICWANRRRVSNVNEFYSILESIPEGGELNVIGEDMSSGRRKLYQATIKLDKFE